MKKISLLSLELCMKKNLIVLLLLLWMVPIGSHADVPDHVQKPGHFVSKPRDVFSRIRLNALARIPLGGMDQWIFVQGQKESNPVLLFLHGGPGVPIIPFVRDVDAHDKLREHFVMVYWDQRGAGHSYHAGIPVESMNLAQFLADTHDLVEILRTRFHTSKIYLAGHSWGSLLGVLTVARYPELFHAYIGIGQAVDLRENERVSYQFAVDAAVKTDNRSALQQLTTIGPPPYPTYKEMLVERKWVKRFGGERRVANASPISPLGTVDHAISSSTLPFLDTLDWLHGPYFSLKYLWDELQSVNLFRQAPTLEVPVYFLAGKYDYCAPSLIVQRYYRELHAPQGKTFIWFDHSAHAPPAEEPNKFYEVLVNRVLPETYH
jgi:pimeloyl-ACP methyl ester carboxylesterase